MKQDKGNLIEALRVAAYRSIDEWIDLQSDFITTDKIPTLQQISDQITNTRSTLLGGCLKEMTLQICAEYMAQESATCPCCGKSLKRHSINAKTLHTMQGSIKLERPYFYCHKCKSGYYPLDQELGLAEEAYQYDVQERMLCLGIESPYGVSANLFKKLTGVTPSSHCLHETLNRIGKLSPIEDIIPSEQEIIRRIEAVSVADGQLPVLVVASDGAHAPTRPAGGRSDKRGPGKWREVKGFRIYLLDGDEHIVQIASWHQIQDVAQFTKDLEMVASRIPMDRVSVALLGDGADWLWNAMVKCFPNGRQVLDYYHCAEHVYDVAKIQHSDSLSAQQWAEGTIARLFMNDTDAVINGLKCTKPSCPEAEKELIKFINYLSNHKHRLNYEEYRDNGLPIGSGGIESSNKHICHVRLKRSGAWWLEENGNTMLGLRCAMYNGTLDTVLSNYVGKKRVNAPF